MQNFGQFIDEIRKEIKIVNFSFNNDDMTITIPPSTKECVIKSYNIGGLEYGSDSYKELLEMVIEQLKLFNIDITLRTLLLALAEGKTKCNVCINHAGLTGEVLALDISGNFPVVTLQIEDYGIETLPLDGISNLF